TVNSLRPSALSFLCLSRVTSHASLPSLLPNKPQSPRERSPLPTRKRQKVRRIHVIHHHIRVRPPHQINHRPAHRKQIPSKPKLFLQPDIQVRIIRKPPRVRLPNQGLLLVHHAERISRPVLQ